MKPDFEDLKRRCNHEHDADTSLITLLVDLDQDPNRWSQCPDDQAIAGYADGTIKNAFLRLRIWMHIHLQRCTRCIRDIAALQEFVKPVHTTSHATRLASSLLLAAGVVVFVFPLGIFVGN